MKKTLCLVLSLLLVAAVFAGCNSGGGSTTTPAADDGATDSTPADDGGDSNDAPSAPAEGQTEISISLWDYSNLGYHKAMISAFEEKYPEITTNVIETTADDYEDKIQIMLSGGDTVDVVYMKGLPGLSALIQKNQVIPLDDYIAASGIDAGNYSDLLQYLVVDGSTYALPFRKDTNMLFFNKDLFDENGVDYPTDGMTMDDYRSLAQQMTFEREDGSKVYGAHVHTWSSNVYQFARRINQYDPFSAGVAAQVKPYYDTILAMQNEDKSVMDFAALKAGNIHYSGVFYNEEVAMMQMGSWFVNNLVENVDFNWGVAALPNISGEGNTTGVGGVTPIAINAKANYPDEAWEFLTFVAGEEGATILAATGILPGYTDDAIIDIIAGLKGVPDNIKPYYLDITGIIIEQPMHPQSNAVYKTIDEQHDLIMTNSASSEEGLAELEERLADLLGDEFGA